MLSKHFANRATSLVLSLAFCCCCVSLCGYAIVGAVFGLLGYLQYFVIANSALVILLFLFWIWVSRVKS